MRLLVLAVVTTAWMVAFAPPALAGCGVDGDLGEVSQTCELTNRDLDGLRTESPDANWEFFQLCMDGTSGGAEVCSNPRTCELRGTTGTWYIVRRDGVTIGRACLTTNEAEAQRQNIEVLVVSAFRELSWPSSELVVQPEGNETLVNLETIFFTSNDSPSTHVVTLAGQRVEIEAVPTYTWLFGDGTTETTTSPGHAYPDHDVFHVYTAVEPVEARVDTTYQGRFRIGDGPWRDIAETLTVAGEPVGLEVLEARPTLVR